MELIGASSSIERILSVVLPILLTLESYQVDIFFRKEVLGLATPTKKEALQK